MMSNAPVSLRSNMSAATLGGQFTFSGTSLTAQRIGYGPMQLAGPGVFGPPKDPEDAVARPSRSV